MARPPVWLLDVDGVINATRPGWGSPPRQASVYADGDDWPMRWAPALIDAARSRNIWTPSRRSPPRYAAA